MIHHITKNERFTVVFLALNDGELINITHQVSNTFDKTMTKNSKGMLCELGETAYMIINRLEKRLYGESRKVTLIPVR